MSAPAAMAGSASAAGPAMLAAPRRVTIAGPATRVDISLPPQATVAELLPQLVRMAAATKHASTGWTLGRLGGEPFDDASTVASAGIRDGEVLYLYPHDGQPLPVLFDDIADAVADAVGRDQGRWRPAFTRRAGVAVGCAAFGSLGVLLGLVWPMAAAGFAFSLFLMGTLLSRPDRDIAAGAVVALTGLPGFALAAARLFVPAAGWNAAHVTAACAGALIYALFGVTILAGGRIWFPGAVLAAGAGCLASTVTLVTGLPAVSAAAVVAASALLLAAALPGIALRLSRIPLPRPPSDTSALRADERPPAGVEVGANALAATHTLTSLLAGLAALMAGAVLVLLANASPWSLALAVLSGVALLLRARAHVHLGQRLAMLLGGGLVLAAAATWLLLGGGPARPAVFAAILCAGAACLIRAVRSEIAPSPYWSRLMDIVEFVTLISLLPAALAILDVYTLAKSLGR